MSARRLKQRDYPCARCGAGVGEPCVSITSPRGVPITNHHQERKRLAPQQLAVCGTHGGYQKHGRKGETPCEPCRQAHAAYMRQYRDEYPANYEHEKRRRSARDRALRRLARAYPDDFRRLLAEETP